MFSSASLLLIEKNCSVIQCTFSFQRSNNWALIDASESIQRNRIWNWQTRETLARGVYGRGGYTPLHTNGKEKTELQTTLKACMAWEWRFFLPSWIQILLPMVLNIRINNQPVSWLSSFTLSERRNFFRLTQVLCVSIKMSVTWYLSEMNHTRIKSSYNGHWTFPNQTPLSSNFIFF